MKKYFFIISVLLILQFENLSSQTLQVTLSPDKSKVDRNAIEGKATIIFNSNIEDLSIVCTDENPDEPIERVTDNLWYIRIDVKKDIESDGICYRNFLLKSSLSAEFYLTTEPISPKQVLYYTITLPNELEPRLLETESRLVAAQNMEVERSEGIIPAMRRILDVMPHNLNSPSRPLVSEAKHRLINLYERYKKRGYILYNTIDEYIESVNCVKFSHNGEKIIACGGKYITLWDTQTCKMLKGFGFPYNSDSTINNVFSHKVYTIDFSPDDSKFVAAIYRKVLVCDIKTGKTDVYEGHSNFVEDVEYSHSGEQIASCSDSTIIVWDAKSGTKLYTIRCQGERLTSVHYSKDDSYIIFSSSDGIIRFWGLKTGKETRRITINVPIADIALSPDESELAVAAKDDTLRIIKLKTGTYIKQNEHSSKITTVSYNQSGNRILTASLDKIIIWKRPNYSNYMLKMNSFLNHAWTKQVSQNQSRNMMSTASPEDSIILNSWNRNRDDLEKVSSLNHAGKVTCTEYNSEGNLIVSSSEDHTIKVWGNNGMIRDQEFGDYTAFFDASIYERHTYEDTGIVRDALFSPSGKYIAFSSAYNLLSDGYKKFNISLREAERDSTLCTFEGHKDHILSLDFYHDETRLLSCSMDNTIRIWDIKNKREEHKIIENTGKLVSAVFLPIGNKIISVSDSIIRLWDISSERVINSFKHKSSPYCKCSISKDGNYLSIADERNIIIFDINTWGISQEIKAHKADVTSVHFSPDGFRLVSTSSKEGVVKVWNYYTGKLICTMRHPQAHFASFSNDGSEILSTKFDEIVFWDSDSGTEFRRWSNDESFGYWHGIVRYNNTSTEFISAGGSKVCVWMIPNLQDIINQCIMLTQ